MRFLMRRSVKDEARHGANSTASQFQAGGKKHPLNHWPCCVIALNDAFKTKHYSYDTE